MSFLEELAAPATLRRAWDSVAAKRGVPGIDRVSIDDFRRDLEANLAKLCQEITQGKYRALPVKRLRPAFLATSDRALVVPAVRDRVVQRAIADLLSPHVEPLLSPACRAFRKGASAMATAEEVGRWVQTDTPWVLRADVKGFFDHIQPEILLAKLAPLVDEAGLRFLGRIVRCRVFDHDQVAEMVVGIPQGSPLSPLLANLYLADLDRELAAEHPRYLRYCDDLILLEAEKARLEAALTRLEELLGPLGLTLNEAKSRLCRAEDGFVFLGYHFGPTGRGPAVKAIEALHFRLGEMEGSGNLDPAELDALHRGWTNYFGDHPEVWSGSALGILALLRAGHPPAGRESWIADLLDARRRLSPAPGPLALALAQAWQGAGHEEQAWLELADLPEPPAELVQRWAETLRVPEEGLRGALPRLSGPRAERRGALAEVAAELGRFDAAAKLSGLALAAREAEAARERSGPAWLDPDEGDLDLLLGFFQGREGVHAVESVARGGHRTFVPVQRALLPEDWRAHLAGEKTLALPLIRAGNTCLLGVLDVDLERKALLETPGQAEELLGRALAAALRLRAELGRRGVECLLELSGAKGHHLWIRLQEPLPAARLRRFLLAVVAAAGPLPEGVRVEEFPNRDRLRPEEWRPCVKLPLGVHGKTGRRCELLDGQGKPLVEPLEAIRSLRRAAPEALLAEGAGAVETPEAPPPAVDPELGPRARKMIEGCHVLGYLARRARETSYLNHRERSSLLCTLGHLGEEGAAALHSIIRHTYNYRRDVTQRHIERLPAFPMSCPKLKEIHPQAAALGTCSCDFRIRGKGYPTPLLLALKPSQIPAFQPRAKETPAPVSPSAKPAESVPSPASEAEGQVQRIAELKRQRRSLEAAILRTEQELGQLFERAGTDRLALALGVLKRVARAEGEGWDFLIEV
ncbi:MAG TPA: CRISPR-associated primase-polymerase type A1 [Thermoanaerobaculia bacterium]|nr:CRISPR-associated primase-polymerase type A1 [Thermoanaerobaculia bacterium]